MAAAVFLPAGACLVHICIFFSERSEVHCNHSDRAKHRPLAMPPLCKGRRRGGTPRRRGCRYRLRCEFGRVNPSVSLTAAGSLSTREPGCGTDTRHTTGFAAHFLSLPLQGKALAEAVPVERKRKDDRLCA